MYKFCGVFTNLICYFNFVAKEGVSHSLGNESFRKINTGDILDIVLFRFFIRSKSILGRIERTKKNRCPVFVDRGPKLIAALV